MSEDKKQNKTGEGTKSARAGGERGGGNEKVRIQKIVVVRGPDIIVILLSVDDGNASQRNKMRHKPPFKTAIIMC